MKIIKICMLVALLFLVKAAAAEEVAKKVHKAAVDENGVQTVEITGGEYYFDPNHIIVKVNVPVVFVVKKTPGLVPHDIIIDEPEAGMQFELGFDEDGERVEFTPKMVGKYPFYCGKKLLFFKGHRQRGMEGIIEVVER